MHSMGSEKVNVIIPTLNAELYIVSLILKLNQQTIKPDKIIVIDSSSDDKTVRLAREFENVECEVIERSDFNHGGTRNKAVKMCDGEYILFLTQDAMPVNNYYIENLLASFNDESVAMVSGRQVAKPNASKRERLVREYNYPITSNKRTIADIDKLGVKAFFFSDVCSAYKRSIFTELGMFDESLETNEDMLMAAKAIFAGYTVAYDASAIVYHSHNFSLKQQYDRNFTVGRFFAINSHKLGNVKSESEGMKMVKYIFIELIKHFSFIECFRFGLDCFMKLVGYRIGMNSINK